MYIKTKDGVYEELDTTERGVWTIYGNFIENNEILNQSENLEELCDEFVYVRNKPSLEKPLTSLIRDISIIDKVRKKSNTTVYGCIWTSKGLIYVAKMGSEGKLVLI